MAEYMDTFQMVDFSEDDKAEMQKEYEEKGVTGCISYINRKNDEWKTIPLAVGVIGDSGMGKSSFINAIRGLWLTAEGAAAVDVIETTTEPTPYPHPNNELLQFWDLPGVGTPKFLKDDYLEAIKVDSYDCFVIITSNRFTENDSWLAREIDGRKKKFYFVRSKIGQDVDNDKKKKKQTKEHHSEDEVVQKIRQNTEKHLQDLKFSNKVYLIDNYERTKYDFDLLEQTIIKDLPALKRHVMILSMSAFTEAMIKGKVEALRQRGWWVATASAAVAMMPIPGVSIGFDAAMLINEMQCYYKQLGLDDNSLKQRAEIMSVRYETLNDIVKQEFPQQISIQVLKTLAQGGGYAVGMIFEEFSRFIPLIGAIVAAPISFAFTKFALDSMLSKMEKVSLELTRCMPLPTDDDGDD